MSHWEQLERPGPDVVTVDGVELRRRSRVRLQPRRAADVFDIALAGKTGVIEEIVESMEGQVQLAVTVVDDPGRDLGVGRQIGHRFFFSPEEVEPLGSGEPHPAATRRILVAGIGNVFLGDDGFGCALARRVSFDGVDVADFGIRGMDLAYALADYDVVVFLDATPRGEAPGTLYLIEPDLDGLPLDVDAHAMHPVSVLALAKTLGGELPRTLVLGCEPAGVEEFTDLSEPVQAALEPAAKLLEEVLRKEL